MSIVALRTRKIICVSNSGTAPGLLNLEFTAPIEMKKKIFVDKIG